MSAPLASVRQDVEALAARRRRSASQGERESADWVAGRLAGAGADDVRLLRFRHSSTFAPAHIAHFASGLLAAAAGGRAGAALSLATLGSYEREFSGRSQWVRQLLPAGEGTTAVARVPAAGDRRRTLVLVAHHDAAHTGAYWRSPLPRLEAGRAERRGGVMSYAALPTGALAATAVGGALGSRLLRAAGAAVLALGALLSAELMRGETVPGASDNASGVAALLALVERFAARPLAGTEVIALVPGSEEAGMGGMRAWLAADGPALDRSSTLVLGLDTLGASEPAVVSGEGGARTQRYPVADLELADRGAARAGMDAPRRWRIGGWTDPVLAVHRGFRAVSVVSKAEGGFPNYHLPSDTPERVDWASVDQSIRLAVGIAGEWSSDPGGRSP